MSTLRTVKSGSGKIHVETGAFRILRDLKSRIFLCEPLCPLWSKTFSAQAAIPLLLVAVALTSACRIDMHVQPRQNPLSRSDFFADQRSARPPVEGTVARGQLHEDAYFYTGKIGNNPGDVMPFPVTKEVLERGQERFNIYCAPCHSRVGDGNGFVPSRGFARKPPSF